MQLHSHTNWNVNIQVCMGFGRYLSTSRVRLVVPWGRRNIMAPSYVLAIDQGTTSTRAILFDKDGQAWYGSTCVKVCLGFTLPYSALQHMFRLNLQKGIPKGNSCQQPFLKGLPHRMPVPKVGMSTWIRSGTEDFDQCHVFSIIYIYPLSTDLISWTKVNPCQSPNQHQTLRPGEGNRAAGISSETRLSM